MSEPASTVAEVAAMLRIREHAVLALIHSGQLRAVDISLRKGKPRWRILPADLESFFARRAPQAAGLRVRRAPKPKNIIDRY